MEAVCSHMESRHSIVIVLMIGLPGSGKTTFTKTLSQYFMDQACKDGSQYDIHVIAYDELIPINVQTGSDEVLSWKAARKNVLQQAENLVKCLKEKTSLEENSTHPITKLIFIDDNMYYRSMRYEYFQLARSYSLSFCQLYMVCPIDDAIKNNIARSDCVPSDVIKQMSKKLQPPELVHNKWENNSLSITLDNIDIHRVYNFIKSSLDHPVPPIIQQPILEAKTSLIHVADLELRKLVGRVMKATSGDKEHLRRLASSLNSIRHDVLARIRVGDMTLPDDESMQDFLAQQMS